MIIGATTTTLRDNWTSIFRNDKKSWPYQLGIAVPWRKEY